MEEVSVKNIENSVEALAAYLNQPEIWEAELSDILLEIDWFQIPSATILPKEALRKFTKSIADKGTRIDVMKFLHKYARYYFHDAALANVNSDGYYNDHDFDMADEIINQFQTELAMQLSQLESTGEYTASNLSKYQTRINELEFQVKELKEENKQLKEQIDKYLHPEKYGKRIPKSLDTGEFINIMGHLDAAGIVRMNTGTDEDGCFTIYNYHWLASKALFGYYILKMNEVLGLRKGRVPLNWKIFEPAISNYDEIVKEARKAFSAYNCSPANQINRLANTEKIDDAIARKEESWLPF